MVRSGLLLDAFEQAMRTGDADGLACDRIGHGQWFLNERRISLACMALGKLEALFEGMVANLTARRRYQLPVTEMQAVQAGLGRC